MKSPASGNSWEYPELDAVSIQNVLSRFVYIYSALIYIVQWKQNFL